MEERIYYEEFFRVARVLPISQAIIERAVALRQMRRIGIGDAIIAGTALVQGLTLVTRNVEDFRWISELPLFNPFEANSG